MESPAEDIGFYSDASGGRMKGWGAIYGSQWCQGKWDPQFLADHNPSIDWMELYALTVGIALWGHEFAGKRILVRCDNTMAVAMVNNQTSTSPMAMGLIRILVHSQLKFKYVLKAHHIGT